jgi:hypothetical protein
MQTILSENCKHTAALEAKLTTERNKQSAESAKQIGALETKLTTESAKQIAALEAKLDSLLAPAIENLKSELRYENKKLTENLTARCQSANVAVQEEFNAKLSSEIRVVSDKTDDVSKEDENKFTTLNSTIKSMRECMNEMINAHVVQTRKETDRQVQEITPASSSLLASIKEHNEQMGVTIDNFSQELSNSKEYADTKFSTVSRDIQHSAAEISRLSATLGYLQAKVMSGSTNHTSAVPARDDVRSEAVQQVYNIINTAGSNNALPSVLGVSGCSTSVCNDVNNVINQLTNPCSYGNVNVTSELHAKSARLCELTLPTFSDSTKQVALHFFRDLDQYFNIRQTLTNYAYLWYSEQYKNLS